MARATPPYIARMSFHVDFVSARTNDTAMMSS